MYLVCDLQSHWIKPMLCGVKHLAQFLYSGSLFIPQHLLAQVGLQNLIMGLCWAGHRVWSFNWLQGFNDMMRLHAPYLYAL